MSYIPGPNRYVCDVLQEMRKLVKTVGYLSLHRHKAMMPHLIEEAQDHVNRMEAALSDYGDYKSMMEYKRELKEELKTLREEVKKLKVDKSK